MIDTLIFDFGGVLYNITHSETIKQLYALSSEDSEFRKIDKSHYSNIQFLLDYEMGLIDDTVFRNMLRDLLGSNVDDEVIDNAWNATLLGLFDDSERIVSQLAKDFEIYLLSNTNKIHFNYFYPQCSALFSYFNKLYLSYELKLRKPNQKIFEFVINDLSKKPQNILFIDDIESNLISAANIGIETFHIKANQNLSDLLHSVNTYTQQYG